MWWTREWNKNQVKCVAFIFLLTITSGFSKQETAHPSLDIDSLLANLSPEQIAQLSSKLNDKVSVKTKSGKTIYLQCLYDIYFFSSNHRKSTQHRMKLKSISCNYLKRSTIISMTFI